jgi:hypothetical protein
LQIQNFTFTAHRRCHGHGHYKITIRLTNGDVMGLFNATTDDMPAIDEISDMEGDEKEMALFNLISDKIEDKVAEWLDRY